jgi:hypothetical protein
MAASQHVLQSTIIIEEAETSIERAKVYSGDHGDAGVLAIFCDGSASPRPHNKQGDFYTGCAAVWKHAPGDAEWQKRGRMLPLAITTSDGAEVCGLDLALESGAAFVARNNAAAGVHTVKLFPAEQLGGPALIKAFAPVFPDVRFMPTGGVTGATAPEYLALPQVLAVGGSWMVRQPAVIAREWDSVTSDAAAAARLGEFRP